MSKMLKNEFIKYGKSRGISGANLDSYTTRVENMTRAVIEERSTNFREIDVFSRLIMDRIIFFGAEVEDNLTNIVVAQLLFLESVDPKKDIYMYINSPGGSVHAGLAVYDTMQFITPDVNTICCGIAASMGAVLLAGGASKKRSALVHSRIMIHQLSGGMRGNFSEMEINFKQAEGLNKDLYNILSKHTGKTYEQIEKDADRDYWMRSEEALQYGIIDSVCTRK